MERKELLLQLDKEHDQIREMLQKLSISIMMEDVARFKELLVKFDKITGPHFRFEEEAVYPALVDIYYPGYISKLYTDHDLVIARFNELNNLLNKEEFSGSDYISCIRHLRMMDHYITGCEILPIKKIPLDDQQIRRLKAIHRKSKEEKLGLISWSDTRRNRKQLYFN